jgi:hypothetical protein
MLNAAPALLLTAFLVAVPRKTPHSDRSVAIIETWIEAAKK